MKLLVVTPYFYPKTGGMENYAWNIVKGLKDTYKWEIVAISSNHIQNEYKEEVIEGVKIYRLPTALKVSNTPVSHLWKKTIQSIVEKEKPDVVNGHTPVPFISDIAAQVAQEENIPFVLTYQNDLVKDNPLLNIIIKGYYQFLGYNTGSISKKIIATSAHYAKRSFFLKKYLDKTEIISPGVNISLIEATKIDTKLQTKYKNKKIVLFVGQLDKTHLHKGLHNLIRSMKQVNTSVENVKLIIIGKGDMIDEYKSFIHSHGLTKHVDIQEHVSNKELIQYYKLSDVVVLPSLSESEGFGMVLIEAGACRKPVIGTNVGGIPFVIDHLKTGELVEPNDIESLSKIIIKLLSKPSLAKKYGENGYKRVLKEFTWDKQIKKSNDLFRQSI